MSQPDHHAVLQDFLQWERQARVEVVADITTDEKAAFMPIETLRSYFQANDSRKLIRILSEVFKSEEIPINPEVILRGHIAVFCILLRISKGKYIEHFARYEELSDPRLPLDASHPPVCFPEATDDPNFLRRFCETQWMYCVPKFDNHMLHRHFGRQRLLPITHKERRGGGGSAIIYKIKLYGPHNKLHPAGSQNMDNTNTNTFILKRYLTKDAEDHYKQEVNGYWNLKHPPSIIGFYGSYTHGDDYNVLLEFADKGSLEEYFQRETPPSRGADIIKFWDGMFQLIKALKAIHSIRGWHQDVKPANVLLVGYGAESPYDWQFKLADFGLSHFVSKVPMEGDVTANDARGTRTYGAPECYIPYNLDDQFGKSSTKITQAVDIWSLGCIYSEAAMWIADGYKGVVDYRRQRMAETDEIPNFKGGDCFHDGEKVLKAVLEAHKEIEPRLRRSDYVTKDVLDSMVEEMLWEEDRPNAKALWRKAEGVLLRAGKRLVSNTTENLTVRPNSNRSTTAPVSPSRPQPPPERPRVLPPGLSSFAERKFPENVETWRMQISGQKSDVGSQRALSYAGEQKDVPESVSELDRELTGSIASWQRGSSSPLASPITSPFTSPHGSYQYGLNRQLSKESRAQGPSRSYSGHQSLNESVYGPSRTTVGDLKEEELIKPKWLEAHTEISQESMSMAPTDDGDRENVSRSGRGSVHSSTGLSTPAVPKDPQSHPFSPDDMHIPAKSQRRPQGFSLFPSTSQVNVMPPAALSFPKPKIATSHDNTATRPAVGHNRHDTSSTYPVPSSNKLLSPQVTHSNSSILSAEYLSLAAALEWKKAHKAKKFAKVPPLPGADLLNDLKDRDHVFIIDDAISMQEQWLAAKTVFEALSYILKPMAPDGVELYFTVSYDTWRRHNTSELSGYLEKKAVAGDTDASYRLGLQLQGYQSKISSTHGKPSKTKKLRPLSFYILTDGNWKAGNNPQKLIKEVADQLINNGLKSKQLTIQYIQFGQDAEGIGRMNDLSNMDFGLDIVDTTPSNGNVLKMLLGALDKSRFQDTASLPTAGVMSGSTALPIHPAMSELA